MRPIIILFVSLFAVAVTGLIVIYVGSAARPDTKLVVYCAAGLKRPVTEATKQYQQHHGVETVLQFGGTGTLITQLSVAKQGDLLIAADDLAIRALKQAGVIREVFPLARHYPVICVKAGNPKSIHSIDDLFRDDVRVGIGNPQAASIGTATQKALADRWDSFKQQVTVMKPMVTEIVLDVTVGSIDAAIVWNSTVPQFQDVEAVRIPEFDSIIEEASIAVLSSSNNPTEALRLARYLTAPEEGAEVLNQYGFDAVAGDKWEYEPKVVLYSGGVNRPAIEPLLKEFATREGAELTTVFNGCGILCASMQMMTQQRSTAFPDAYYACDLCFVPPVAEHFPEAVLLTQTDIGIVVPAGNPKDIASLADLAQAGLKIGICNAMQSTLGYMTEGMLKSTGFEKSVRKNVVVEVPTADFLINQMRASSLDAAIVYHVNAKLQSEHLDFIPINHPGAHAVQPFSIRHDSPHKHLVGRLLSFLQSNREAFEKTGFLWRGDEAAIRSDQIEIPFWLRGGQSSEMEESPATQKSPEMEESPVS